MLFVSPSAGGKARERATVIYIRRPSLSTTVNAYVIVHAVHA